MTDGCSVSLLPDTTVAYESGVGVSLTRPGVRAVVKAPSEAMRATIERMAASALAVTTAEGEVAAAEGERGVLKLRHYLKRFEDLGLLSRHYYDGQTLLASFVPIVSVSSAEAAGKRTAVANIKLSRFAHLRLDGSVLIMESPLCRHRVELHDGGVAAMISQLCRGDHISTLAERAPMATPAATTLLTVLHETGFAVRADPEGVADEQRSAALQQWEFHDLLFHWRSRRGAHSYTIGAAFPFAGQVLPLPAIPERPETAAEIPLNRADLAGLRANDRSFSDVLESRRSTRVFGRDLSIDRLGEFLDRSVSVRTMFPRDPDDRNSYEGVQKVFPSGGGTHDLEFYLVIGACEGISPGLYQYNAAPHTLTDMRADERSCKRLLRSGAYSTAMTEQPPIAVIITSRFQRLSWKYRGISYATTLKNVGAAIQTMYLVATCMGLACCACGAGDTADFASVTGLDWLVESTVGELILGAHVPAGAHAPSRVDD
jgi:oxazoline/thiazoline dehydrogenase